MNRQKADWTSPLHLPGTNGEAVVLIHGYTGHPGHWLPSSQVLGDRGYTVVAPRLAGHAGSVEEMAAAGWRHWLASAEEAVASVAAEHTRVHLVGLSLGGLLGVLLARPTAASSLVAINPPLLLHDLKAYATPLAYRFRPFYPAAMENAPDPGLAHLWMPQPEHSTAAVANLVFVIGRAFREAGRLRRPALVIQSRADRVVRPLSGALLARRLNAALVWIGGRHNALLDPGRDSVHEAILDHLERASPLSR